jgi:hypothetical protein
VVYTQTVARLEDLRPLRDSIVLRMSANQHPMAIVSDIFADNYRLL